MKLKLWILVVVFVVLSISGCNPTVDLGLNSFLSDSDQAGVDPEGIVLSSIYKMEIDGGESLSNKTRPILLVYGATSGDYTKIYTESTCTELIDSFKAVGDVVRIQLPILSEGKHKFYAQRYSPQHQVNSPCSTVYVEYEVDTTYPTLTINSQVSISYENQSNYLISGTCSENDQSVDIFLDSLQKTVNCTNGLWSTEFDASSLADGAVQVKIRQSDRAGNVSPYVTKSITKTVVIPLIESTVKWSFDNSSDYQYENQYVDVSGGKAFLKKLDLKHSLSDLSNGSHVGTKYANGELSLDATTSQITTFHSSWTPHYDYISNHWNFENNSLDSSISSVVTTSLGGAVVDSVAKVGSGSVLLNGSNAYLRVSNHNSLLFNNDFSIAFWFKTSKFGKQTIIGKMNIRYEGFTVGYDSTTTGLFFQTKASGTSNSELLKSNTKSLANDEWYHAVVVYDKSNSQKRIYINGQLDNLQSISQEIVSNSSDLLIGMNGNNNFDFYSGNLDELAIWNSYALNHGDVSLIYHKQKQRHSGHYVSSVFDAGKATNWSSLKAITPLPYNKSVASEAEVTSDYSASLGTLQNGLIAHYSFDEVSRTSGAGNDVKDMTGRGNNGEYWGDLLDLGTTGMVNKAVRFTANTSMNIPHNADFPLTTRSAFSFAFWVKAPSNQGDKKIFSENNQSPNTAYLFGPIYGANGKKVRLYLRANSNYSFLRVSNSDVMDNTWHHVAFTDDNGNAVLYVDGVRDTADFSYERSARDVNITYIASEYTGSNFKGNIDEMSFWSRAISADEVKELYQRTANRTKYQVKSCIDSSCECASFSQTPQGSSNDCDGDGILNSNDTEDIHRSIFKGPGGDSSTFYSEEFNRSSADIDLNCGTTSVNVDVDICLENEFKFNSQLLGSGPEFNFGSFANNSSLNDARYFQYKVFMESESSNDFPSLSEVQVGPSPKYYGGAPSLLTLTGISYKEISSISISTSGTCTPTFQLSGNGDQYYYVKENSWVIATSNDPSQSSPASVVSNQIASFVSTAGEGVLKVRMFFASNTNESCEISEISVTKKE